MSSRIVRAIQAAELERPMSWPTISPGATGPVVFPHLDEKPQSRQDETQASAPQGPDPLELRIAELEQQLARKIQEARDAAFRDGVERGRQEAAAQWNAALGRLARTIEELSGMKHQLRKQAEQDVVKLSLAIARRVLYRELAVDPEALAGLVNAALQKLDAREVHRVRCHPQDAPAIRQALEQMGAPRALEVAADGSLERGAALFESARGTLDASVDTQLEEIGRGFTDILHRNRQGQ